MYLIVLDKFFRRCTIEAGNSKHDQIDGLDKIRGYAIIAIESKI